MATKGKIKPSRVNVPSVAAKSEADYLKEVQTSTADLMASGVFKRTTDTKNLESALGSVGGIAKAPIDVSREMPSAPLTLSKDIQVGSIIDAPISRIKESKYNARVFYASNEVDAMGDSLIKNGQEAPIIGYLDEEGGITIIDGQKRLRGARSAGIERLVVYICEKPENPRTLYLASRRINKERSDGTFMDDAVRFSEGLAQGLFKDQEELAREMKYDASIISMIISLNKIPSEVISRVEGKSAEEKPPILNSLKALYALAQIFSSSLDQQSARTLADEIVDESNKKGLSGNQVVALIKSRMAGPKRRDRNEVRRIKIAGGEATFKSNSEKGRLDFSLRDLPADKVEAIKEKILNWCATESGTSEHKANP
jgi:ParB family transcriptional regulator, chromosome partitioning protein